MSYINCPWNVPNKNKYFPIKEAIGPFIHFLSVIMHLLHCSPSKVTAFLLCKCNYCLQKTAGFLSNISYIYQQYLSRLLMLNNEGHQHGKTQI